MADTTDVVVDDEMIDPVTGEIIDQKELAERLLAQAKEQGVSLTGPGGLFSQLTKSVLETALNAELTEHLGHEHGGTPIGENMRNGTRVKTVLTEIGPVEIEVPRDRDGSFEPVIVPKRKRRLDGVDQIVLSLTARGLTTGEIAAHFDEVYGAKVSKDTISRITEKVTGELAEWSSRPLDALYPVIFVDAIAVKVRDGQVRNTPFYVVMGVSTSGERDILGIWAGDGQEGARFWLQVFTELKNRGVEDVLIAVCDGLKGLPEAINTTWEQTVVQQCIVHLIRNSFRYAGRQHRDAIVKALKPVYTAPSEQAAKDRFEEFAAEWGEWYPAIVQLWRSSWAEFVPFLVQRRVVEPPDAYEAEPEVRQERSLGALEALAEVQLASEGHLDELVAAGVEDRRPERTAAELAGLWEAVRPRLDDEQAALLPELDGHVRGTLALLARQPAVLVHGDPHLGNVLADEAGRPQLIDWTDAALAWPGVDLFVLLPRRGAGDGRREALLSAYAEALGARHEAGVRLGTEVAPTYHALSYLRIGRFLPAELAGDFLGAVTKYVERQLEVSGLVAEA